MWGSSSATASPAQPEPSWASGDKEGTAADDDGVTDAKPPGAATPVPGAGVDKRPVGVPRPAEPAAAEAAGEAAGNPADKLGFSFGSYGRIGVGTDLRGSTPESVDVVAHGTRVVQPAYLEIDTYYRMKTHSGRKLQTVATLAFDDTLFHYTGRFEARPALRNLYAEAEVSEEFSLWIGSRMYRGDDIYLFDIWPLDNVNTLGGGVRWVRDRLDIGVHMGANRLLDPFQYQEDMVPGSEFEPETITQLDRQRMVASVKATYLVLNPPRGTSVKAKVYAEVQGLPEGTRLRPDASEELLPGDFGWTLGAQVGAWGYGQGDTHGNLFLRWSRGLNAFDELQPPTGFDPDMKLTGASEFFLGAATNYEMERLAVQGAAYLRRFVDADVDVYDVDDGWEYIIDVRPHYSVLKTLQTAVDLSYQLRFPRGINDNLGYAADPAVFQIAPMLVYSPFGNGSYERPVFRLIYRAAHLNEGARALYPIEDPRGQREWSHFLGFQAEWWFNSTYR